MDTKVIKSELARLDPDTPWAHLFHFAPNIWSVNEKDAKFYKKAIGLNKLGEIYLKVVEQNIQGQSLRDKKVVDLGCGEGAHSVLFASHGAEVTGVDGRQLYIDRAKFAAKAMGQQGTEFIKGDIRRLKTGLEKADVVLFSGILHHLGIEDFDSIIQQLGEVTKDILIIYTHVATELSVLRHGLKGPKTTDMGREGFLFREHQDGASPKEREARVRASLDNTFSFWAREYALIGALQAAGFFSIQKVLSPHPFGRENASYRPILVAKKH